MNMNIIIASNHLNEIACESIIQAEFEISSLAMMVAEDGNEIEPTINTEAEFSDEEFDDDAAIIPDFLRDLASVVESRAHIAFFRNIIAPELIAKAMHPRRMMARISQFDDIESFFECC